MAPGSHPWMSSDAAKGSGLQSGGKTGDWFRLSLGVFLSPFLLLL